MPQDSKQSDTAFAVSVRKGIDGVPSRGETSRPGGTVVKKRPQLTADHYVNGVLAGDRTILGRAVTLIESNAPAHFRLARQVLKRLLPHSGGSVRIGITGAPGSGKSTLIEALGCHVVPRGHRVAVLAVDPSSTVTGGSILGDKTRMEKLSRLPDCFIRPSPSGGTLGGVARKSRETIQLCEAAGYDTILVETVGVGQSEVAVRSMVDFFLLVLIAGAGDELQGIKRGIMESVDGLVVNKSDGPDPGAVRRAAAEYAHALKYLPPATPGRRAAVHTCSALTGDGIPELWTMMVDFSAFTRGNGFFEKRRQTQALEWVNAMIEDTLTRDFHHNPGVRRLWPDLKEKILRGTETPATAAEELLETYYRSGYRGGG